VSVLDLAGGGLARGFQDGAVGVEQPAMVAAAYAVLLDDAELERGVAVAAQQVQQPIGAGPVAEQHQVLAHPAQLQRQFANHGGERDRHPEPAQILAAGCARHDAGDLIVRRQRRQPVARVAGEFPLGKEEGLVRHGDGSC